MRLTVGGDIIEYPSAVTTPTANLQTINLYLKSEVSDVNAAYLTVDINKFYLNSPMNRYQYMHTPAKQSNFRLIL